MERRESTPCYIDMADLDMSSIAHLISNQRATSELNNLRKHKDEPDVKPSEELSSLFQQVYTAYEPLAERLIASKVRIFPTMSEDERDDVYAEQHYRLWKIISRDFRWEDFDNAFHATGAFVKYLELATGSFFAKGLISRQKQVPMGERIRKKIKPLSRPVEDVVISRECPDESDSRFERAWEEWYSSASPLSIDAIELRYFENKSIKDQALESGLKEATIKKRIIVGKKLLFDNLAKHGVITPKEIITRSLTAGRESRIQLLNDRRVELLKRLPRWLRKLEYKPKMRSALFAFYGLDGNEPLFDYKKTAEATGLTLEDVRKLVAEGVNFVMGHIPPSEALQNDVRLSHLYEYWKSHRLEVGLAKDEELIITLYFDERLVCSQIAKQLGTSEETVRRRKMKIMNIIEAHMNSRFPLAYVVEQ